MEEVFSKLTRHVMFNINIFGTKLEISDSIVVSWIVMAILILAAFLLTRKLKERPTKTQGVVEMIVEGVNGLSKSSIGHHYRAFAPYLGTMLLFIAVSNIMAIFNVFPFMQIAPPTKNINITAAMAVFSMLVVIFAGFRYKGFVGWVKWLITPMPILAPFKLLDYVTRPLSLSLRLFGNIFAGFLIMEIILHMVPFIAAPLSLYFDLFDGFLQAFVFVYLTSIYIGEALE